MILSKNEFEKKKKKNIKTFVFKGFKMNFFLRRNIQEVHPGDNVSLILNISGMLGY